MPKQKLRLYETIFLQSPVSTQVLNPKGETIFVNKAFEDLWHARLEDLVSYNLLKDQQLVKSGSMKYIKRAFKGESVTIPPIEYVPPLSTDTKDIVHCRWLSAIMYPIRNEASEITHVVLQHKDITEQVRSQQKFKFLADAGVILSQSLNYKENLAKIPSLAVRDFANWCGVYLMVEGKLEILAADSQDKISAKKITDFRKHNPLSLSNNGGIGRVVKTGKPLVLNQPGDKWLKQATGEEEFFRYVKSMGITSLMVVPIRLKGKTEGIITFVSRDPGHMYNQDDLVIAQELALLASLSIENSIHFHESQRALILRDEFISFASHELKTPLTSLNIYLQAMQRKFKTVGETDLTKLSCVMNRQIHRLGSLIDDMLNVSRIAGGKLDYSFEATDINEVASQTIEMVQELDNQHRIILKGKVKQSVLADGDRIGQVLTNLLTNAIKFSPKANKIEVKLTPLKRGVKVSVTDYGIGIDENHLTKVFDKFYRVDGGRELTYPGLGMGLYLSAQIIKRHHGKIWVKSQTGKGSVFSFTLPYHQKNSATLMAF